MAEVKKMIITEPDGSEVEVDVVVSFYNKDKTKQYVMYTRNEKQGDNTIVYTSSIIRDGEKIFLDEIESDEEWLEVKDIIREMLTSN